MPNFDWNIPLPLHFGQAETPPMSLVRALPDETRRPVFEAYIQQRFRKAHGADIRHFMPELFGLNDASGELCAVAGVRLANTEELFLERYLDEPIDPLISAAANQTVDRTGIVEVGNLAASDTGSARLSIIAITYLLAMGGLEWVAFTGNIGLVNSFHRLGLKPVTLCAADPARLGDDRHSWGSYYDSKPWVHVGNIRAGFIHLRNIGLFNRLGLPTSIEEDSHVA
ncbi:MULTISPECIES: thermostable hemolysin [unclassified Pseudomonas]|uniref:thermostable hemolysin n=1 Tax=unclassified Pseudomonas TaxID=196821 RepID=UPI001391C36F|nr:MULTISPECIES: thermostable hemolysin [unclassified Pseudomonas]MBH1966742.1 thermostable hemolysin [Pseudomonadales bacterium]KAI2680240.1 thermostable hemolysin [Pseudomonas sp. TNT3]MBF4559974.1 thermostable hemolysin [Pseudomonas sp. p50(2008)]MBH2034918.1 thermostable hemolysin [Pseudomonadales bacterium]MBH2076407.1 thermostable hemolysin [Pseudomonadales bacterium]